MLALVHVLANCALASKQPGKLINIVVAHPSLSGIFTQRKQHYTLTLHGYNSVHYSYIPVKYFFAAQLSISNLALAPVLVLCMSLYYELLNSQGDPVLIQEKKLGVEAQSLGRLRLSSFDTYRSN